jgi:hypothetical protein
MFRWSRLRWILLLSAIVGGHVALWLSPRTPADEALRLTLMNASIWAVVLLPAVGVTMWARAHRARPVADPGASGPGRAGNRSADPAADAGECR